MGKNNSPGLFGGKGFKSRISPKIKLRGNIRIASKSRNPDQKISVWIIYRCLFNIYLIYPIYFDLFNRLFFVSITFYSRFADDLFNQNLVLFIYTIIDLIFNQIIFII